MNMEHGIGVTDPWDATLPDPEQAEVHLRAIMLREGAAMSPGQFIESVAHAYKSARIAIGDGHDTPRFHDEPSHPIFEEALRHTAGLLPESASVLVLGCGDSYLGCDSAYAEETVRRVIPPDRLRQLRCLNLSRSSLLDHSLRVSAAGCDLVVSHSLLHFIADLPVALRLVGRLAGKAGYYLMAHEPNARFWRNRELLAARKNMIEWRAKRKRWAAYLNPLAYALKLRAVMGLKRRKGLEALLNELMVQRHGVVGGFCWPEIARLTDPHRPCEAPGGFRIGLDGLHAESLARNGFDGMSLVWQRSYEHLGPADYSELTRRWRRLNEQLHAVHPLDGACWTALWRAAH